MLDYSRVSGNEPWANWQPIAAKKFFLADKNCPLAYEPSGEDFLSPCLGEADVMRRILPPNEFAKWLTDFMPQIPDRAEGDMADGGDLTRPGRSELAHLDGLNLSRAWMLEGILAGCRRTIRGDLPVGGGRRRTGERGWRR